MCGEHNGLLNKISKLPIGGMPRQNATPKTVLVLHMHHINIARVEPLCYRQIVLFWLPPFLNRHHFDLCIGKGSQRTDQRACIGRDATSLANRGVHANFHVRASLSTIPLGSMAYTERFRSNLCSTAQIEGQTSKDERHKTQKHGPPYKHMSLVQRPR